MLSVVRFGELDPGTLRALEALSGRAEEAGLPHLSDQAMLDLSAGGEGACVVAGTDGFSVVSRHGERWVLESVLAPGVGPDVDQALVRAALEEVTRRGGGTVRLWRADGAAAPVGFHLERELLQLRVPLPLPRRTSAVGTRAFRPGEDEEAWLAVNNRAFAGHPEQSGWTLTDVVRREAEPWFDPAGFLLYEATARLAAFCWTKIHPEGLGEIYVIAVDPDFQGRGLGKLLTEAGLDHLAGCGVPTGMLYVDGDNTAAVALYRSLGFQLHHADRSYLSPSPPPRPGRSRT